MLVWSRSKFGGLCVGSILDTSNTLIGLFRRALLKFVVFKMAIY